MATSKTNPVKKPKASRLWPEKVTARGSLVMLSVMLNVALAVVLWAVYSTNMFDKYVAHNGVKIYCSQEYRAEIETYEKQVSNDFACSRDDAKTFYMDALNEYRLSKSLEALPVDQ